MQAIGVLLHARAGVGRRGLRHVSCTKMLDLVGDLAASLLAGESERVNRACFRVALREGQRGRLTLLKGLPEAILRPFGHRLIHRGRNGAECHHGPTLLWGKVR